MAVFGYDSIVDKIATALGLECKQVKRMKIDFPSDDMVTVRVTYYPTKEQMEEVSKYFKLCRVEEMEDVEMP